MANKKKSKKRKRDAVEEDVEADEDELCLDDVLYFGGSKDDYELVKDADLESSETAEKEGPSLVEQLEVKKLLKELGLSPEMAAAAAVISSLDEPSQARAEVKTAAATSSIKETVGDERTQPLSSPWEAVADNSSKQEKARLHEKKKDKKKKKKDAKQRGQQKVEEIVPNIADLLSAHPRTKLIHKKFCGDVLISPAVDCDETSPASEQALDVYFEAAEKLYINEVDLFNKQLAKDKSGDAHFMRTALTSGTLSDRMAAITLRVQESPVHSLSFLDSLLQMARKNKREGLLAADHLSSLFQTVLLPDRKLIPFKQRSNAEVLSLAGYNREKQDQLLVSWMYEDELIQRYTLFVDGLLSLSRDPQWKVRRKVMGVMRMCLSSKPEQEEKLLAALVNKLGDPDHRVGSGAVHQLHLLLAEHHNMRLTVVEEVERFMYRPNVGARAQYYSVCFLNQLVLDRTDKSLANRLIALYFSFFRARCKQPLEGKMLSGLLSGINRAFTFADLNDKLLDNHINELFHVVHQESFSSSVQALMLLLNVAETRQSMSDRFYTALYAKLVDPDLRTSSKQSYFLHVLSKAMKADPHIARVKAFAKRLLQVCGHMPPPFVCGALLLLSVICSMKPSMKTLVEEPEDDDECFVDEEDSADEVSDGEKSTHDESKTERKVHSKFVSTYQPLLRNPLYCKADRTCGWELSPFLDHFHPSVSVFSRHLIAGDKNTYNGDPLQDFVLMRFLDRFVYKNPKKSSKDHGGSVMQRKSTSHRVSELPVNHVSFWSRREENVAPDEVFFHRFFRQQADKLEKREQERDRREDEEKLDIAGTDFDFASNLEKVDSKEEKIEWSDGSDADGEEPFAEGDFPDDDLEDVSDDEEFNYSDLDNMDDEDGFEDDITGRKPTQQDYEKALLENLSSDDEVALDEFDAKSGNNDISSLFLAADELGQYLESRKAKGHGTGNQLVGSDKTSEKQLSWEAKQIRRGQRYGRRKKKFTGQPRRKPLKR